MSGDKPSKGATVRAAATVVVLRPQAPRPEAGEGEAAPELYMLRRSSKSAFMPDALVFPGGGVDPEDIPEGGDRMDDAAFAQAARRECMEEANLTVEPEQLRHFDTWKTPSGESPRRFLARFFVTQIPADAGHEAEADGSETSAGRWATAATILAAWEREEVDLPPPTVSILLRLRAGDWREWLTRAPALAREPIVPKVRPSGGELHILMPRDPEYAETPGDAGSEVARAAVYPRRFVRVGKRWIPHFD